MYMINECVCVCMVIGLLVTLDRTMSSGAAKSVLSLRTVLLIVATYVECTPYGNFCLVLQKYNIIHVNP